MLEMARRMTDQAILELRNLKKHFASGRRQVTKAVDGVSLRVEPGATLGLVGESGCGKSTIGKCILGLYEVTGGEIFFEGKNIRQFQSHEWLEYRRKVQTVFQDPYGSLNPRMNVQQIVTEPLVVHRVGNKMSRRERAAELCRTVGLKADHLKRYPHEFSGGQRQRICIARALSLHPHLVVLDEPVSALDVSIRAQILNLLKDLQGEFGLTYLFVSHDLSVVQHMSDTVAVMYLGRIVEIAPCDDLFHRPVHPYTRSLLSAVLTPDPEGEREIKTLKGDIQDSLGTETGCMFRNRCDVAGDMCGTGEPRLREISPGHHVACHLG
jgi:oligopeptide/dipeptide ABC transporter ATP-binding protein